MSEALPEPTLPIFGEKTVAYTVVHSASSPDQNGEGGDNHWETVHIPVDEIDTLENSRLRDALWQQFCADENKSSFAIFAFVNPDGDFMNAVSIPRKPLSRNFSTDGTVPNEGVDASRTSKERETKETMTAGWIKRLFSRD